MPNGNTHYRFWKAGRAIVLPASFVSVIFIHPAFGTGMALGYMAGNYVTPDWDDPSITKEEGRMIRDFKILGWILYGYSSIYGAVFKGNHRHFLSHFPFISTAIRLFYLLWWILLLDFEIEPWMYLVLLGVFFGLGFSDTIHSLADMIFIERNSKLFLRKKINK